MFLKSAGRNNIDDLVKNIAIKASIEIDLVDNENDLYRLIRLNILANPDNSLLIAERTIKLKSLDSYEKCKKKLDNM